MKKLFQFLVLSVLVSQVKAQMNHDHPAVHGMLVVGTRAIYLSHLPMFHSPHDYQVIFEAELDPSAMQKYLKNKMLSIETIYTLVPQAFVLPVMAQNPRPFMAQLYKGHFERGGELIASSVQVKLKRVVYFKKLQPNEKKPSVASFLLFGNQEEQFMAHFITGKPDFDQILQVKLDLSIKKFFTPEVAPVGIVFPGFMNKPLISSQLIKAQIIGKTSVLSLAVVKSLYLEFGDLEH